MLRGNTQQPTHSPAGDFSHGFPAPQPVVGVPDHLVFLVEDKFVHSHQAQRANSTQLLTRAVLGVVVRLEAQVVAVFVLIAQRSSGLAKDLQNKSTSNQRQKTEGNIDHDFPIAAAVPQRRERPAPRAVPTRRLARCEKLQPPRSNQ